MSIEPIAYARDLDGTGSLHMCAKGDPGAISLYAEPPIPEQPDDSPFDSPCMPDHKKLAEEIMRFIDETEKHDFLDKDHLHRTIQDAVWIALECAKNYGVAEGWKRGSSTKREMVALPDWLMGSAQALLDMDASGSLAPHGIGGHARSIIEEFMKAYKA